MATYLVTGAAGFIASKVCEFLLADGHTVVGIDNLNDYYDVRLKDYRLSQLLDQPDRPLGDNPKVSIYLTGTNGLRNKSGQFLFRVLDIENLAALDALFQEFRFDAVFNLAARAGVRYSIENPHVYLTTNAHGTLNLLECVRKYGVKKFVLASTSSLYAGCPMPFTEELSVNLPLSPYAASKKAAEMMTYSYHKLYGMDVTVLRYFTVYGPAGRPDMAPLRFVKWIDEGTPIELFGDGSQSRDFTYVDDVARGTIAAIRTSGYEIINIGGGRNPISLQTVISLIEKALTEVNQRSEVGGQRSTDLPGHRVTESPKYGPIKAKIVGKPFHVADIKETWADISKAETLLGWKPEIAPEEGFRRCVYWHVENRKWLRSVEL